MGPGETRDLLFAGAGIIWGAVTVFRGVQAWQQENGKTQFPMIILVGIALAIGCLGYLVHRL